jgi:hypothetical protein
MIASCGTGALESGGGKLSTRRCIREAVGAIGLAVALAMSTSPTNAVAQMRQPYTIPDVPTASDVAELNARVQALAREAGQQALARDAAQQAAPAGSAASDVPRNRRALRKARERANVAARQGNDQQHASADKAATPTTVAAATTQVARDETPVAFTGLVSDISVSFFYPAEQDGDFVIDGRVHGRDAQGKRVDINPTWVPANPAMLVISPSAGGAVKIRVRGAGETRLTVAAPGVSKEVRVSATPGAKSLQVQISQ